MIRVGNGLRPPTKQKLDELPPPGIREGTVVKLEWEKLKYFAKHLRYSKIGQIQLSLGLGTIKRKYISQKYISPP